LILTVKDRHSRAFYALEPINIRHKIENFVAGLLQIFICNSPLFFVIVIAPEVLPKFHWRYLHGLTKAANEAAGI